MTSHRNAMPTWTAPSLTPVSPSRRATSPRERYLRVLVWAFTLFNSVRVLTYVPTMWAIHVSGNSSQHSLWTWLTWLGANATMAAYLYEQNGQRIDRPVVVNVGNAVMCAITTAIIGAYRW